MVAALNMGIADDPVGFLQLVDVTKDGQIKINTRELEKLFCNEAVVDRPVSIFLVLGPSADTRSSLISKLLDNNMKHVSKDPTADSDLSNVFLKFRESGPKGIVAWGHPVLSKMEGEDEKVNFFLDIWGDFDDEDPLFILFAGIASILASSIVYVTMDNVNDKTWDWLKKVIQVTVKAKGQNLLQKILFLIQGWDQTEKFPLGIEGGLSYLKELLSSSSISGSMSCVHSTVPELKCYLFPANRDNSIECRKHLSNLEDSILKDDSLKFFNGAKVRGASIPGLLQNLPKLQDLLNFPTEGLQLDKDSFNGREGEIKFPEHSEEHRPEDDGYGTENLFGDDQKRMSSSSSTCQVDELKETLRIINLSLIMDPDQPLWEHFDIYNDINVPSLPHESITLEQYLQQCQNQAISLSLANEQQAQPASICNASPFDNREDNMDIHLNPSNADYSSVSSLNTLQFQDGSETDDCPTTSSGEQQEEINSDNYSDWGEKTLPELDTQGAATKIESFDQFHIKLSLQASEVLKEAELQSEITVHEICKEAQRRLKNNDASQSHSNKFMQIQEVSINRVVSALELGVRLIVNYQDVMDRLIEVEMYFDEDEDLLKISRGHQRSMLDQSDVFDENLFAILENKLKTAEGLYLEINREIREKEDSSIMYALSLAGNFYWKDMSSHTEEIKTLAELQNFHEKVAAKCKAAFYEAYFGEPSRSHSQKLDDKLNAKLKELFDGVFEKMKSKFNNGIQNRKQYPSVVKPASTQSPLKLVNTYAKITQSNMVPLAPNPLNKVQSSLPETSGSTCQPIPDPRKCSTAGAKMTESYTSPTKACRPIPIAIGMNFGLDFVSAGTIKDGEFRSLYGPLPNTITVGQEVTIGEDEQPDSTFGHFSLRKILLEETRDTVHDCGENFKTRAEFIVALVLSKVHQVVKANLHTDSFTYIIAFPTFFNEDQLLAMTNAVAVAGLDATVVRETSALACQYIHSGVISSNDKRFLIAIEDEKTNSCDLAGYEVQAKTVELSMIHGGNPSSHYRSFWKTTPGIQIAFDHVKNIMKALKSPKVFIKSMDTLKVRDFEVISKILQNPKIVFESGETNAVQGASRLACYKSNKSTSGNVDLNPSRLLAPVKNISEKIHCRIKHTGMQLSEQSIEEYKENLRSVIDRDFHQLKTAIETGKRTCLKRLKEIDSDNCICPSQRSLLRDGLSKVLREIDSEYLSSIVVTCKVNNAVKISYEV